MNASELSRFDVAIIGGALMGSSVAYHLLLANPHLSIAIIEPDPDYQFASSARASGGCRVQFTCPENIAMSLYSIDFIKNFDSVMRTVSQPADVGWVEGGYRLLAQHEHIATLERNVRLQREQGCVVELLSPSELKSRFPSMNVSDLGVGAFTPHDGWCNPIHLLWGFRRKVVDMGASYIAAKAVAANSDRTKVQSIVLSDGRVLRADAFVNAAGAWAGEVAALFGMPLPIRPMPRLEHYFTPASPMEKVPYIKEFSRLAFRSEGTGFSGGLVDGNAPRGFNFEVDHGYFDRVVKPAAAHRFPVLQTASCERTWSGLYEQNEFDGNPVIGVWSNGVQNLYTVAGFSGHGMMHAPAAGRAISELILHGVYQSIDLSKLGYQRIHACIPYSELGIV